jgi:AcrR family transcriptional regulator
MPSVEAGPRRRADAVRNRERVIMAASEVFSERGLGAGVPEIAGRAGVGKGTVYRCFPTKEHLIGAVAAERMRWFLVATEAAAERPDAGEAFRELLLRVAERQASDNVIADAIALDLRLPELVAIREATTAALGRLLRRAQEQGAMRPDVTAEDVRVLVRGVARLLRADERHDPAAWRRYAALIADGLRAGGERPLA